MKGEEKTKRKKKRKKRFYLYWFKRYRQIRPAGNLSVINHILAN